MNNNIAYKLRLIRKIRGMSMDKLVNKMGGVVSKMSISKYERGIVTPNISTLEQIAKALGVCINDFYTDSVNISKISFRYFEDHPSDVSADVMQIIQSLLDEYIEAEKLACADIPFANPLKDITICQSTDIEEAAETLRKVWQLGQQPIMSVYEALIMNGIRVLEFYYENQQVNGISLYANNKLPFVLINSYSNRTTERKRFTALHELGHLLLNVQDMDIDGNNMNIEKVVNHFAGAMLLPRQVAYKRIGTCRDEIALSEFISIKNLYGISVAAINYRVYELNVITHQYRNYIFDDIIKPNFMEKGWGGFPIQETADRLTLIEERIKEDK